MPGIQLGSGASGYFADVERRALDEWNREALLPGTTSTSPKTTGRTFTSGITMGAANPRSSVGKGREDPGEFYARLQAMMGPGVRDRMTADYQRVQGAVSRGEFPEDTEDSKLLAADLMGGFMGTFGGVKAATAPLDDLARAKSMAAQGADERAIWKDTGWLKGADDQWRFEIDDTVSFLEHPMQAPSGYEALQHMDVQDAYPKMWGGLSQSIKTNPNARRGRFEDNTIFAEGPTSKDRRSVALHELQHGIQGQEGFAKGGSLASAEKTIEQAKLARDALSWRQEMKSLPKDMDLHARHNAVVEQYRQMDAMDWLPSDEARQLANQPFDDSVLEQMAAPLGDMDNASPHSIYRRLAGEAEARAVQKRMDYTPEQRREVFPFDDYDVPRDKLIVRGAAGLLGAGAGGIALGAGSAQAAEPQPAVDPFAGMSEEELQQALRLLGIGVRAPEGRPETSNQRTVMELPMAPTMPVSMPKGLW
jgi:hypothetical protein